MKEQAVQFYDESNIGPDLRAEVLRGLASNPKFIPPKFFYDRRGSELFDKICRLPEYYPTRAEIEILKSCSRAIAHLAGSNITLIELGSGASEKVRLLLDALRPTAYLAIDISRDFLLQATRRLAADYPWLSVHAACADFSQPLHLTYPPAGTKKLAFFPGSSIGNFDPDEAVVFLTRLRSLVGPHGALVIGVDLKKDPHVLHAAYNDTQGVTAAFNLNLLRRIKRELKGEVDIDGFEHQALYNETLGRIEMYLVSRRHQSISIDDLYYVFAAGERLHTENSYKYTIEEFQELTCRAGYEPQAVWTDPRNFFSVHYLVNSAT